jgi:hypothetical protein
MATKTSTTTETVDVVAESRNIASLLATASTIRASVRDWHSDSRESAVLALVAAELERMAVRDACALLGTEIDYS